MDCGPGRDDVGVRGYVIGEEVIPMLKKIFEFLTLKWLWDRR
jgi:hypothetical protein